ncbi:putative E3 ubiquitin-protein ligase [Nymphaea thermarum]|nr:putative E3 ubiquitin-protein ligase [Nymphaea thermarum]
MRRRGRRQGGLRQQQGEKAAEDEDEKRKTRGAPEWKEVWATATHMVMAMLCGDGFNGSGTGLMREGAQTQGTPYPFIFCCGHSDVDQKLAGSGDVYSFGQGIYGALGLSDTDDHCTPTHVQELWGLGIIQIACGENHSAALSVDGQNSAFAILDSSSGTYEGLSTADYSQHENGGSLADEIVQNANQLPIVVQHQDVTEERPFVEPSRLPDGSGTEDMHGKGLRPVVIPYLPKILEVFLHLKILN